MSYGCELNMYVVGPTESIERLLAALAAADDMVCGASEYRRTGEHGVTFSTISAFCRHSAGTAMLDDPYGLRLDHAARDLRLDIEVYSRNYSEGFSEHIVIEAGTGRVVVSDEHGPNHYGVFYELETPSVSVSSWTGRHQRDPLPEPSRQDVER